jgi:uncharacterized protein YegP (UPF0339 family)
VPADPDQSGFVIDEVPGSDDPRFTWCLLDRRGDVLARAPRAYETRQEAQVAIAEVKLAARESDVPVFNGQTIPADA